ncbi:MAG: hypothetical protein Q4E55_08785 [Bacteroidales bacterium]|nr:hypothetical protein [Bacteroidales bacterium]
MKKLLLTSFSLLFTMSVFAQKVTIKSGTIVPLEAIKQVKASNTHEGETIDFRVSRDVKVGDVVAIPAGAIARGSVYEAKRSTAFGTKGRLGIKLRYVTLPSGDVVNFTSSDVYIEGKNRTPLSVVVFCFTLLPFPCGSKAVMPIGYECDATVAGNTEITIQ